jgi:hypothetical protein
MLHIFIAFSAYDLVHDIYIIFGLAFGGIGLKGGCDKI